MKLDPQSLGALANAHQLLLQLATTLPPRDCNRRFGELPSVGWLLGRAVYLELHVLRGVMIGDDDLASRVRHLFADATPGPEVDAALPPQDHLLRWATEALEQHLTRLANPGALSSHPLLEDSGLVWQLIQHHALTYEQMLAAITARSAHRDRGDYRVDKALTARQPIDDSVRIEQGHYRIGEREGRGLAHERPAQLVELHAYRISRRPVCNAEFLAFIEDGGYRDRGWWDEDGLDWRNANGVAAPWNWCRDVNDNWYAIGTNGPLDLLSDDIVAGLSAHEARAFAAWAAARGAGLAGAVPQHEYQWEVAARLGEIDLVGRSWEWCANAYHDYPNYQAPTDPSLATCAEGLGLTVLRGSCLHTQPALRRTTFRRCALPARRDLFAGTRLVMPPGKAVWE